MKKMFSLVRVLYKAGGGLDGATMLSRRKKKTIPGALRTVLLGACFLPLAFLVYMISTGLYATLAPEGQQSMLLQFANALSGYLTMLFGIYYVAGALYFSSDNAYLLALPFSPWQVAGARFFNLLFYEYIVNALLWIPYIVYGAMSGAGALYYVYAFVSFAAIPVIPLSLCAVLVLLMMRLLPFFRNKDLFTLVSTTILMAGMIAFSLSLNTTMGMLGRGVGEMLANGNGVLRASRILFPGLSYSATAMAGAGTLASLGDLALFLLCNAAALAVFLLLARVFYLRAATGAQMVNRRGREKQRADAAPKSAFVACAQREWLLLVRSPVALFNCVAINFLWPVFMGISMFSGQMASGGSGDVLAGIAGGIPWREPMAACITLGIFFAAGMFLGGTNLISATAVSREGSVNFAMLRSLPVPPLQQALAKIGIGVALGFCALAILFVCALLMLGMPLLLAVAGLAVSLGTLCAVNIAGFLLDLKRPRIHWENEQQAIKQNLNGVYVIFGSLGLGALIVLPVLFLFPSSPAVVFIALLVAGWALSALLLGWLRRVVQSWMMRVEI